MVAQHHATGNGHQGRRGGAIRHPSGTAWPAMLSSCQMAAWGTPAWWRMCMHASTEVRFVVERAKQRYGMTS